MLSCFPCVTAPRPARQPAPRLHAAAGAIAIAPPPPQALLRSGIRPESLPRHVAVVMDGNRRWAQARGMLTAEGHKAGRHALEHMIWLSHAWGIRALTVFAFSQENVVGRPKMEVDYIMGLIEQFIRDNIDEYARNGIRLHVIGDTSRYPVSLRNAAGDAEEMTRNNSQFNLMLATCYSGRWDIMQACRVLAGQVQSNTLRLEDIDEALLASKLATSVVAGELSCPDPDLIIRTSGQVRLSNFLMWQSAYSELYFTDAMWPDFGETEYLQALSSFQSRERRFGQ